MANKGFALASYAAAGGNRNAYVEANYENLERVIKHAVRLVLPWDQQHNWALQEELERVGWSTVLVALNSYKSEEGSALTSWLLTSLRRDMQRYVQYEYKHTGQHDDIDDMLYEDDIDELTDEEAHVRLEWLSDCVHLIERLPIPEQDVIVTHYFEDASFAEIAEDLGISKQAVFRLHKQALERLRAIAGEW